MKQLIQARRYLPIVIIVIGVLLVAQSASANADFINAPDGFGSCSAPTDAQVAMRIAALIAFYIGLLFL